MRMFEYLGVQHVTTVVVLQRQQYSLPHRKNRSQKRLFYLGDSEVRIRRANKKDPKKEKVPPLFQCSCCLSSATSVHTNTILHEKYTKYIIWSSTELYFGSRARFYLVVGLSKSSPFVFRYSTNNSHNIQEPADLLQCPGGYNGWLCWVYTS